MPLKSCRRFCPQFGAQSKCHGVRYPVKMVPASITAQVRERVVIGLLCGWRVKLFDFFPAEYFAVSLLAKWPAGFYQAALVNGILKTQFIREYFGLCAVHLAERIVNKVSIILLQGSRLVGVALYVGL